MLLVERHERVDVMINRAAPSRQSILVTLAYRQQRPEKTPQQRIPRRDMKSEWSWTHGKAPLSDRTL